MNREELVRRLSSGAVIRCNKVSQKRHALLFLFQMGYSLSGNLQEAVIDPQSVDMYYPLVGISLFGRVDCWPVTAKDTRKTDIIPWEDIDWADEAEVYEVSTVWGLYD